MPKLSFRFPLSLRERFSTGHSTVCWGLLVRRPDVRRYLNSTRNQSESLELNVLSKVHNKEPIRKLRVKCSIKNP